MVWFFPWACGVFSNSRPPRAEEWSWYWTMMSLSYGGSVPSVSHLDPAIGDGLAHLSSLCETTVRCGVTIKTWVLLSITMTLHLALICKKKKSDLYFCIQTENSVSELYHHIKQPWPWLWKDWSPNSCWWSCRDSIILLIHNTSSVSKICQHRQKMHVF